MKWWFMGPRPPAPVPTSPDDARAALAQSVDDLLGGVQMRREARQVGERIRAVERRNHLRETVQHAFRETR